VLVIQEAGGDVLLFEFVNMSGKCKRSHGLGVQLRVAVALFLVCILPSQLRKVEMVAPNRPLSNATDVPYRGQSAS
jgi:hypothetical protein